MSNRNWSSATTLVGLLVAELFVIWAYRQTGFLSISDDDYARLVIAQEFVKSPSLDPSGSSWLPFPFVLLGCGFFAFGTQLAAARGVQLAVTLFVSGLLYFAARCTRMRKTSAALFAFSCLCFKTALPLASATVPEFMTHGLIAIGALSLLSPADGRTRMFGAVCMWLAVASRYEAWAAAAAFSLITLFDARALSLKPRMQASLVGFFPQTFVVLWVLWGLLHHRDAFFFLTRVSSYKAALGHSLPDAQELLFGYPVALLRVEPEITWGLLCCGLGLLAVKGSVNFGRNSTVGKGSAKAQHIFQEKSAALASSPTPYDLTSQWWRPLVVGGAVLAFLVVGAARGGAPTHHPERALLCCWMLMLWGIWQTVDWSERRLGVLCLVPVGTGAGLGLLLRLSAPQVEDNFAWRAPEEAAGQFLRQRANGAVGLALPDYGYFAVMAAAGDPERFSVLAAHDPRTADKPIDIRAHSLETGTCTYVVASETSKALKVGEPPPALPAHKILFENERVAVAQLSRCSKKTALR